MKAALIALLVLFAAPAMAQQALPSTPDLSVSGSSTTEVQFGGKSSYVYVKNDCSSDLYFNFGGKNHGSVHPLLLKQAEVFEGAVVATTMGVSTSAGDGTTCTFTLMTFR
jgi:hypothetical protein